MENSTLYAIIENDRLFQFAEDVGQTFYFQTRQELPVLCQIDNFNLESSQRCSQFNSREFSSTVSRKTEIHECFRA
jgi:hypothetical protein